MLRQAAKPARRARPPTSPKNRPDTRARLLEAAGHVFAQKGFDRAVGREICDLAEANSAAVNYYFGGMEGLYSAVLDEARARLVPVESFHAVLSSKSGAKAKLEAVIELAVRSILAPPSKSWIFQVIAREIVSPSDAFSNSPEAHTQNADRLMRIRLLKSIVSEVMNLPQDHPAVERGCLAVAAPLQILLIADRRVLTAIFPTLGTDTENPDKMVKHLVAYALGGLAAAAKVEEAG